MPSCVLHIAPPLGYSLKAFLHDCRTFPPDISSPVCYSIRCPPGHWISWTDPVTYVVSNESTISLRACLLLPSGIFRRMKEYPLKYQTASGMGKCPGEKCLWGNIRVHLLHEPIRCIDQWNTSWCHPVDDSWLLAFSVLRNMIREKTTRSRVPVYAITYYRLA